MTGLTPSERDEITSEIANLFNHGLDNSEVWNMITNDEAFSFEVTPPDLIAVIGDLMYDGIPDGIVA